MTLTMYITIGIAISLLFVIVSYRYLEKIKDHTSKFDELYTIIQVPQGFVAFTVVVILFGIGIWPLYILTSLDMLFGKIPNDKE